MLDIQFIRENADLVQKKADQKNIKVSVGELLKQDESRKQLQSQIDELRQKRNEASNTKGQKPTPEQIEAGKKLKTEIAAIEATLSKTEKVWKELLMNVPNIFPDDTPIGDEEDNQSVKEEGGQPQTNAKDHLEWGEKRGMIDFERGAKVAGAKFYYLKGALVELELACIQLVMSIATKHGFTPMLVPHMVNEKTASGTGFSPRGEEDQIYSIKDEDLHLIATAEIPITGYHAGEILNSNDLPLLYVGVSPSYRKEAGAYGKHSKGLFRVHQFNKVEMYVFCEPEDSEKWHQKLVAIEEEICEALDIPYRVVRIASGDLGAPAYKKFDVEYWSPVEGEYRELMSCSNVTDYQARRLQIKYKGDGGKQFVHTLNGTAMPFSRTAIALIENHQQPDGSMAIPNALQPYMNGKKEI